MVQPLPTRKSTAICSPCPGRIGQELMGLKCSEEDWNRHEETL